VKPSSLAGRTCLVLERRASVGIAQFSFFPCRRAQLADPADRMQGRKWNGVRSSPIAGSKSRYIFKGYQGTFESVES
jgi:hypothetical protein